MGLDLVIGAASAVISLFSGMAQADAQRRQANAMAQSAEAQREANRVEAAQQEVSSGESRRQRVREARIRRAQIIAASGNQGTSGSSGAIGAVGALGSNLGGMNAFSLGETTTNRGISANLQRAADFTAQANKFAAQGESARMWGNTFQSALSGFKSIFD